MSTTPLERSKVFICHALPEDNVFAMWLAVKLRNEGYDVWCEVEQVYGGEYFWREIQPIIEESTAKFIFIASHDSVQKLGVRDEWDFAREIARRHQLKDFIIPLNLDGVIPGAIIGMTTLAMIQFQNSWADGVRVLVAKLRKDNVPCSERAPLSAAHWYQNRFATTDTVLQKQEIMYSNWVALPQMPSTLFLHEYTNDVQAKQVLRRIEAENAFPADSHDRYLLSFESKLPDVHQHEAGPALFSPVRIQATKVLRLKVRDILEYKYKSDEFPTTRDASNFLVQLLQRAVREFLLKCGLQSYEMANGRLCFFYTRRDGEDYKVQYEYEGKIRKKKLTGLYHEDFWHFGVSVVVRLHPHPHLSLKSHIIFSKDGINPWQNKDAMQSARRKKGKRMFNAAWRDLQLAFLGSLADDAKTFGIPVGSTRYLWLSTTPVRFMSDRGYRDPQDSGRLIPLDDYDDSQENDADTSEFNAEAALSELLADAEEVTATTPDEDE